MGRKKNTFSSTKLMIVTILGIAVLVALASKVTSKEETDNHAETTITANADETSASSNDEATGSEASTTSKSNVNYEIPAPLKDRDEQVISHTGYTLSYNKSHNTPNWSAWKLTKSKTQGTLERGDKFWADPDVSKSYRVDYYEYKESGYDRGHMCPAGDMKWSEKAMHDCFYMTNMCPQVPQLNSGSWKKLEEACRQWAVTEGSIYIICGPIYTNGKKHEQIGIDHVIDVPEAFFKAVLSLRKGHEKAIGFRYDNTTARQSIKKTAMSVDDLEKLTGIDFFYQLDDKKEAKLESSYDISLWK